MKNRTLEMIELRKSGLKFREIGERFGITRQAAYQALAGFKIDSRAERTAKIIAKMSDSDLSKATAMDFRKNNLTRWVWNATLSKINHACSSKNCYLYWGLKGEEVVSKKLSEINIAHKRMPLLHPFDILTEGGISIDVKACWVGCKTSPKNISKQWAFSCKKPKTSADFFALIAGSEKLIFIVPNSFISRLKGNVYIVWPSAYPGTMERWRPFLNAFHLLKNTCVK